MRRKYNIKFILEKRKDKITNEIINVHVPINLHFTFGGKRLIFYTGYRIDEAKWDSKLQKVKMNCSNRNGETAHDINRRIDKLKVKIEDIYDKAITLKDNITLEYLKERLKDSLGEKEEKSLTLSDLIDSFIEYHKNDWTNDTAQKFKRIKTHITDMAFLYGTTLDVREFNADFFTNYFNFSLSELKHRNTTISKNMGLIKWFLNWVNENQSINTSVHKKYKVSKKFKNTAQPSNNVALSWTEVMHLYNLDTKSKTANEVLDCFLFSCFTGLRHSDLKNLKKANIKKDFIELTTIKTRDHLIIDLNKYSKAIIDKYKNLIGNYCLPVLSNQQSNLILKDIGQIAKFNDEISVVYYKGTQRFESTFKKWQLLSTHVARRTFITTALLKNIPVQIIMAWTGHKDYNTFEGYINITATERTLAMNKFDV